MNIELAREIFNRKHIPIWDVKLNKYYIYNTQVALIDCKKSEMCNYIIKFIDISFVPLFCSYQSLNGKIYDNIMNASNHIFTDIDDLIPEIKLILL